MLHLGAALTQSPPDRTRPFHRVSSSLLGPVDPSFRALSGRLMFTVRRHKFNKDSVSLQAVMQKLYSEEEQAKSSRQSLAIVQVDTQHCSQETPPS